ncbi:DNA-directed RNA polymerase subunit omega [Hymenobacter sp.]|uniref:DNA-directed RNA polymerase subunit omega n=1 Tax=Hymenobacter sp. TaxID=1898978 RepID=UPI00286A4338|nr:DNA-directed RNA polymerase subunit omega [Hymenobacter sp.]
MKPNSNAPSSSIITRNVADITGDNGNVYEAIAVISKRANQLSVKLKEELNDRLAEFASTVDNLEEVFENREQIEISKFYERMPKPTSTATEEFLEGKLNFRRREETPEKLDL